MSTDSSSEVLARCRSFLPKIAAANEQLINKEKETKQLKNTADNNGFIINELSNSSSSTESDSDNDQISEESSNSLTENAEKCTKSAETSSPRIIEFNLKLLKSADADSDDEGDEGNEVLPSGFCAEGYRKRKKTRNEDTEKVRTKKTKQPIIEEIS